MIYILLNLYPILAATLAALIIDAVWLRLARQPVPGPGQLIVIALAQFWFAAILAGALILAPPKADPWVMAIGSAVVIWIGFVAPALIVTHLARRAGVATALLDSAHWLAVMVAEAVVLKSIGLVPPPA